MSKKTKKHVECLFGHRFGKRLNGSTGGFASLRFRQVSGHELFGRSESHLVGSSGAGFEVFALRFRFF